MTMLSRRREGRWGGGFSLTRGDIVPWMLLGSLLVTATDGLACEKKDTRKVRVSVLVILASEKDTGVEKKLECIGREAQKMYPKLKGFRSGNMAYKSVPIGTADSFELVEGKTINITIQRAADKMDRVCLKIAPPSMGAITYSTPCGKFLPVLTPFRTSSNEAVLIAIRVQPCPGK